MHRRLTIGILAAVTLLLVAWDVYVALEPVPGDTISEVILEAARRRVVVPFLAGVLCGHLFWPQYVERKS